MSRLSLNFTPDGIFRWSQLSWSHVIIFKSFFRHKSVHWRIWIKQANRKHHLAYTTYPLNVFANEGLTVLIKLWRRYKSCLATFLLTMAWEYINRFKHDCIKNLSIIFYHVSCQNDSKSRRMFYSCNVKIGLHTLPIHIS